MDFILSRYYISAGNGENILLGSFKLGLFRNNNIQNREFVSDTTEHFIACEANPDFLESLGKDQTVEGIENNILRLVNGYVIFFDKRSCKIFIFNDIFGYCHLYHLAQNNGIVISSDFNTILSYSKKQPDDFAILDLVLFNYTLLDRTLISDVKRLRGGSKIVLSGNITDFYVKNNFADNFTLESGNYNLGYKVFSEILSKALFRNLAPDRDTFLSLTAGYDSRMLLAICRNLKLNISTFTFGQENNIEEEVVKSFISTICSNHEFIRLDSTYIEILPELLNRFLIKNLDNPVILDLPHYFYVMQHLKPSNIITGFMGGEITAGQSIGSQVTFTQTAAKLLISRNLKDAEDVVMNATRDLAFLQSTFIKDRCNDYIATLSDYFFRGDKINILSFLINESYSKFFGTINKIFRNHSNLINPFIDADFINYVLNSRQSFLRRAPFSGNPVHNLRSRMTYARSITNLYAPLGNTRLDRLYKINDLCFWYRYPNVLAGYVQSHMFKKNKKNYPKPHHYDLWYKDIVTGQFEDNQIMISSHIFNNAYKINSEQFMALQPVKKKKHSNVAGVILALKNIQNQVND